MDVSPLNILLADDERLVAFSVAFALKCDGHKIQIVVDGAQALASVRTEPHRFGLLITDHSMPGTTGIELVQRLREESFCGKIMVLSAHLSPENRAVPRSRGSRMGSLPPRVRSRFSFRRPLCTTCSGALVEEEEPDEAIEGGS